MTLVVDALNRIARGCKVSAPSSWVSATDTTSVELRDDWLQETIADLQKRVDWQQPISAQTVIVGDGSEDYNLPSDFLRLAFGETAVYETTQTRRWGVPISSDGAWTQLKTLGNAGTLRHYRLKGYPGAQQISFYRHPTSSDSITVSYMTDKWMANNQGVAGNDFTAENDVLLYDRRPIELGTIYRWRQDKGFEYEAQKMAYEAWIASRSNQQRGLTRVQGNAVAPDHPMRVPAPDFIPSS